MSLFSYRHDRHAETGQPTIRLSAPDDRASAQVAPASGCNLLSFQVEGTEYIFARPAASVLKLLGTPILYPMPNRVRNGQFTFEGRTFTFPTNMGGHFIHGLVRDQAWQVDEPVASEDSIACTARIRFAPDTDLYKLFPIQNTLEVTYTLKADSLRMGWRVQNDDKQQRLPFGLAIHPYFPIIGPRESARIQVPASKWMEAVNLMPTGRLMDLSDGPANLRQPVSLAALNLDDVFWGMQSDAPATIYYDSIGKTLTLGADDWFTHVVVYTPQGQPYFCIENQSCSTDAHNLYTQGLQKAAHLSILEPGQTFATWLEWRVASQ